MMTNDYDNMFYNSEMTCLATTFRIRKSKIVFPIISLIILNSIKQVHALYKTLLRSVVAGFNHK